MNSKSKNKNARLITITIPYRLYVWAITMSALTATLAVLSALENRSPLWVVGMGFLVVVSIITAVRLSLAEKNNRYNYKTK